MILLQQQIFDVQITFRQYPQIAAQLLFVDSKQIHFLRARQVKRLWCSTLVAGGGCCGRVCGRAGGGRCWCVAVVWGDWGGGGGKAGGGVEGRSRGANGCACAGGVAASLCKTGNTRQQRVSKPKGRQGLTSYGLYRDAPRSSFIARDILFFFSFSYSSASALLVIPIRRYSCNSAIRVRNFISSTGGLSIALLQKLDREACNITHLSSPSQAC